MNDQEEQIWEERDNDSLWKIVWVKVAGIWSRIFILKDEEADNSTIDKE